jgi:hypothetical protein
MLTVCNIRYTAFSRAVRDKTKAAMFAALQSEQRKL